ncbi:MAG: hypothetical protein HOL22_00635 [Euryarchaeota archaeon]|jgi:hypothetical protein|nr:hypothetical protein [Euryarchaeota archaeon]MBT5594016.1 hypothetical protein [Euryarchaeota archaeon]MBT5844540.1 hypothetical protein [Euryarchaeota archaeon]MBT6641251.1 hypothetical protein [Euryarchaeota archaeon]MBT6844332.1 hypothetical protein [Euryarchaeota archaeon]
MSGAGWNVVRCGACKTCHGHRGTGRNCPHCGQKLQSDAEIVISVATPSELRIEVALANTPEELRDSLRKRLQANQKLFHQEEPISFQRLPQILLSATDGNGALSIETLQPVLDKNSINIDVEDLIAMSESQGLLVRLDTDCWQLLE